jgi:pimeloyl-ACP methyl ester carboxylesterase
MSTPEARLAELGGAGPDLLFIHGFGSDRLSWSATAPAFFATHRVWAVDLPGHGEAPAEVGDGTPEVLAQAVAAAVTELARPFAVIGHSLGGAVALALARQEPGAVAALALIAPVGLGAGMDREFLMSFPKLEGESETQALLQKLVVRPRMIAPGLAGHILAGLERPGRRKALARIGKVLAELPAPALPEGLPLRLIWGAEDRINPHDPARAAAWGERFSLIDGAGHLPHVEAASRVNRLIAQGFSK